MKILIQKSQIQSPDSAKGCKTWSNGLYLFLPKGMNNDEAILAELTSYLQNWKISYYLIQLSNSMEFT